MNTQFEIKKLTNVFRGHMLHHNSVFSADDKWIVFDGRNDETKIGETPIIGAINIETKEEKIIYATKGQTIYGPGVGAASFSPKENKVIFIHGLFDANKEYPYDITRRFGMVVDLDQNLKSYPMDARDIVVPYTRGTLRGGTHSHCWSPDGTMLSFTYNDEFTDPDLRTIGVMLPQDDNIKVPIHDGNHNGQAYSVLLTHVVRNPCVGTDEISKAFDECWIVGDRPKIAFQGNTLNDKDEIITEIFTVEFDKEQLLEDTLTNGTKGEWPQIPRGIRQKRISYTSKGLSSLRHWLRASPDGQYIYALAQDDNKNNQIVKCSVETGIVEYITDFDFSITSPINLNSTGEIICFLSRNNLYLYDISSGLLLNITDNRFTKDILIGSPVFFRNRNSIAFNVLEEKDNCVHIYLALLEP